jgi:hypothetical protein
VNDDTSAMFQQHSADVPRDRWGRYLLPGEDGDNVGWTRATTFAATLAEAHGLRIYEQRQVVLGMGRRPDLVTLASTIAGPEDKKALGAIVDSAHEAAGTQAKANRGTAIHAAIQRVEQAPDFFAAIEQVPEELRRDVRSYFDAVDQAQLRILPNLVERVVIVPQYRVAGTPDNYMLCPDGKIRVLDKKTGNLDYASIEFAVQLALYANAKALRNYGTNSYEPLPEVATDYAIIAHVVPGTGRTELMRVNIAWGWAWARTCAEVMDIRKTKNVITPYTGESAFTQLATPEIQQINRESAAQIQAAVAPRAHDREWLEGAARDFGVAGVVAACAAVVQADGNDTSALFYAEEENEDPSPGAPAVTAPAPQDPAPAASPDVAPVVAASAPTTPAAGVAGAEPPLVIDDPEAAAQALVDGAKGKAKLQQAARDFAAEIRSKTGVGYEFKLNQHQIKLARDMVAAAVTHGVELPAFAPSSRSRADTPETEDEKRLTVQLDQIRRMPTVEGLTQYQAQLGERWTDDHQQAARVRVEEIHAQTDQKQTGLTVEQIIDGATSMQTLTIAWRKATNNNTNPEAWTPELQKRADAKSLELTGTIGGQTPPQ